MNIKLCQLLGLIACLGMSFPAASQSLVGSTGATQFSANYTVSWSLGELMTDTFTGDSFQLTQGLHQGIVVVPLGINHPLKISVYPNPTSKRITITSPENATTWSYQLLDANGKEVLSEQNLSESEKVLDLVLQNNGLYFLKVNQGTYSRSFKIIKSANL